MIVTRKRKKPFPWRRVLIPLVIIAVLIAVLRWEPARNWILNGPLAPVAKPIAAPLDAMATQRQVADLTNQVASLQQQLAQARSDIADRDKQASALQSKLSAAEQTQAVPVRATTPAPTAAPSTDLASDATPEMRRTAAVWTAMDSEAAAKVVQRLPQAYVVRVFSVMSPDAVGAILENLPAAYAASLTQEHPELKR